MCVTNFVTFKNFLAKESLGSNQFYNIRKSLLAPISLIVLEAFYQEPVATTFILNSKVLIKTESKNKVVIDNRVDPSKVSSSAVLVTRCRSTIWLDYSARPFDHPATIWVTGEHVVCGDF